MPVSMTEEDIISSLVFSSWPGGGSLVLSYSVPTAGSAWLGYGPSDFPNRAEYSVFNSQQGAYFVAMMELYDSYVAASFVETSEPSSPGDIRIAFSNTGGGAALAYSPGAFPHSGDIWFGHSMADEVFGPNNRALFMLHEIAHALGLQHPLLPDEYNDNRYTLLPSQPLLLDANAWVISASAGNFTAVLDRVDILTPMMFDILALQSLYGADPSTNVGDTVYTFDPNTASLQTIYDAGGIDTWDLTGHARPSVIDLRPASLSSVDWFPQAAQIETAVLTLGEQFRAQIQSLTWNEFIFAWTDNVAIAFGTIIENVLLGDGSDEVVGNDSANVIHGNGGSDTLNGGAGDDTLHGGDGSDELDGGAGIDAMTGGAGNDTYYIDEAADTVIEVLNEGADVVQAVVSYLLGANVETLTLSGNAAINGTGNALDNSITGNSANNTLDGGVGGDTMVGGDGDDIYIVDNVGDVTSETSVFGGVDTVQSALTRTLGANLENLMLTGASAINGFGNASNNIITGNSAANQLNGFDGADVLNGGTGADAMFGGNGDDAYYVDTTGDVTSEVSALGGADTVFASVSRNLTANIENLTLTGAANLAGSGNSLNNIIIGNTGANTLYGFDGNDRLDGGTGADTLFGAAGNDVYVVDDVNDITVEGLIGAAGGSDLVISSISRNLNANFEDLILAGAAQYGYGNVLDNGMNGNSAANGLYGFDGDDTLNGGAGADQMFGANGDDTYIVDNAGDVTSEVSALGGMDTVISSVTRNLTANLENLTLSGSADITGAGNALNNVITGNSGVNTLYGLDGADTLDGGLGADTLQGGAGADTYVFTSAIGGGNVDAIVGFNVADDTFLLNSAIFTGLSAGALDVGAFVIGAAAADADDRIIYNSATGQLYFDADGSAGGSAILFATLAPGLALTSADFIIGGP